MIKGKYVQDRLVCRFLSIMETHISVDMLQIFNSAHAHAASIALRRSKLGTSLHKGEKDEKDESLLDFWRARGGTKEQKKRSAVAAKSGPDQMFRPWARGCASFHRVRKAESETYEEVTSVTMLIFPERSLQLIHTGWQSWMSSDPCPSYGQATDPFRWVLSKRECIQCRRVGPGGASLT